MAMTGKTSMIKRLIEGKNAVIPKRDERTIGGMKGSPNGSEFDLMIGHNKTNEETVLELLG